MGFKAKVTGLVCAVALCCILGGCAAPRNTVVDPAVVANRQYMTSVHQTVASIQDQAYELSGAIALGHKGDIYAALDQIDLSVKSLEETEAPEALSAVHENYVDGCTKLASSLRQYADLLFKGTAAGDADAATQSIVSAMALSSIQSTYDAGISALKTADALANS